MKISRILPLAGAAGLLAAGATQLVSGPAVALALVNNFALPTLWPGAEVIMVEGEIEAFDAVNRTVTIDGTVVQIPATLLIDVTGDGVGDITFSDMVNPAYSSPIGADMILDGVASSVNGLARFTATTAYFAFGEQVIVGPLINVDAALGTFQVAGTTCKMSPDPRMRPKLLDLGSNQMSLSAMAGWEGSAVSVGGYLGADGILYGTEVLTAVIVPSVHDSIAIEKALWTASKRQIDMVGTVTAHPTTKQIASTVQLDLSCDGLGIVSATVIPDPALGLGTWKYRSNTNAVPVNPGTVCGSTSLGGTVQRTVDVK